MKLVRIGLAGAALMVSAVSTAGREDYRCENSDGCTAEITIDGELQEFGFRRGDIIGTEGGWIIHPHDPPEHPTGWVKIPPNVRPRNPELLPWLPFPHIPSPPCPCGHVDPFTAARLHIIDLDGVGPALPIVVFVYADGYMAWVGSPPPP